MLWELSNISMIKQPSRTSKGSVVDTIERLRIQREARRRAIDDMRVKKAEQEQLNRDLGLTGDIDFQRMIMQYRSDFYAQPSKPYSALSDESRINVCVRKRPIFQHEVDKDEIDAVSVKNPVCIVHECKFRVDGITKFLENHGFQFDATFHEESSNEDVYSTMCAPLLQHVVNGGRGTLFAYGQTGSGKTHTMQGVQHLICQDLVNEVNSRVDSNWRVYVSAYEIYGGKVLDLLNDKRKIDVLEDARGEVQLTGLVEVPVITGAEALQVVDAANAARTTHATTTNADSSRSHSISILRICQLTELQENASIPHPPPSLAATIGKLTLVDLAGSERAQDYKAHSQQRRTEGAEINKSLLALKECIRAIDINQQYLQQQQHAAANQPAFVPSSLPQQQAQQQQSTATHVPFRGSKLTLVLRDSFIHPKARTVMIACVSPGDVCSDHTSNTLRYAARLKDKPSSSNQHNNSNSSAENRHQQSLGPANSFATDVRKRPVSLAPQTFSSSYNIGTDDDDSYPSPSPRFASGANASNMTPSANNMHSIRRNADTNRNLLQQQVLKRNLSSAGGAASSPRHVGAPANPQPASPPHLMPSPRKDRDVPVSLTALPSLPSSANHRPGSSNNNNGGSGNQSVHVSSLHSTTSQSNSNFPKANVKNSFTNSASNNDIHDNNNNINSMIPTARGRSIPPTSTLKPFGAPNPTSTNISHHPNNNHILGPPPSTIQADISASSDGLNYSDFELLQLEDEVISRHMSVLQEDAQLLTKESQYLASIQQQNQSDYDGNNDNLNGYPPADIDSYAQKVEKIAQRKLYLYKSLLRDISILRKALSQSKGNNASEQRQQQLSVQNRNSSYHNNVTIDHSHEDAGAQLLLNLNSTVIPNDLKNNNHNVAALHSQSPVLSNQSVNAKAAPPPPQRGQPSKALAGASSILSASALAAAGGGGGVNNSVSLGSRRASQNGLPPI